MFVLHPAKYKKGVRKMDAIRYMTSKDYSEFEDLLGQDWKLQLWESANVSRYEVMARARNAALKLAGINGFDVLLADPKLNYDKGNLK
jgi:hypothetical protein